MIPVTNQTGMRLWQHVNPLSELLAARISEEIDKLVQECEAKEGKDAADLLRASITRNIRRGEICIRQR